MARCRKHRRRRKKKSVWQVGWETYRPTARDVRGFASLFKPAYDGDKRSFPQRLSDRAFKGKV